MQGFDPAVAKLMSAAVAEAVRLRAEAIAPLHLFLAVLGSPTERVEQALVRAGQGSAKQLRERVIGWADGRRGKEIPRGVRVSGRVLRAIDRAQAFARAERRDIDGTAIFVGLLHGPDAALEDALTAAGLSIAAALGHVPKAAAPPAAPGTPAGRPPTPLLDELGRDLTALARDGKLDPVIGRKEEIKEVVRVLLRKGKSNPVLIGEAGVGKTAIVEGLARRIVEPGAPADIRNLRIVELPASALVAGASYRGEMEERVQKVLAEAQADKDLVLFMDELHTIVGAGKTSGGSMDLANLLKPVLARGAIRCIGATTDDEYRKHIEKDAALERRFQPVRVEEPTPAEAREILAGLRSAFEAHHNLAIGDDALDAAVELSVRHLPDRRLPDKARDVLDQAAVSRRFLSFTPHAPAGGIGRDDVARVIAKWTGIPVERLTEDEKALLARLEEEIGRRVVGQDDAVKAVAHVVRTGLAGLAKPGRPYGVLLFVGPTGVGKTELARALAEVLFGDEKTMLRFDMSEHMEAHSVSRLIGSPPGYVGHDEGGRLTDAVRRTPHCVILLDEIEKAHPRVLDLFLQVFDDGRLTDSRGRQARFENSVIIMTSNLGAGAVAAARPLGFGAATEAPADDPVERAVRGHFRPELLNRISRIVRFRGLEREDLRRIVDKMIRRVGDRLADKRIELRLAEDAYDVLLRLGYDPALGAREMERAIEMHVVHPLAEGIVAGRIAPGATVHVVADGAALRLDTARPLH